jgi:hypothetical protein
MCVGKSPFSSPCLYSQSVFPKFYTSAYFFHQNLKVSGWEWYLYLDIHRKGTWGFALFLFWTWLLSSALFSFVKLNKYELICDFGWVFLSELKWQIFLFFFPIWVSLKQTCPKKKARKKNPKIRSTHPPDCN